MTHEEAGFGEQALNKMTEMALTSQLAEADQLKVKVKTDPGNLAQGKVEAIAIDGEGLVMQEGLRMDKLDLQLGAIAVNPFKALFGNLELTRPTEGKANIVLTEADINRAFSSEFFQAQLRQITLTTRDTATIVDIQQMKCHLLAGKIALNAGVVLGEGEKQQVAFTAVPRVSPDKQGVVLQEVQYTSGKVSPELTTALLDKASEILNLNNFKLEGMTLEIQRLDVDAGQLTLEAEAQIEQFPSA